jgi:growth arrest-specific protein 8
MQILEKKVVSLKDNLEKRELQVAEILKSTDLDPVALSNLSNKIEVILTSKNDQIKHLQYELAKISKSHNDMLKVYEAKLQEYSIPPEEMGLKALVAL